MKPATTQGRMDGSCTAAALAVPALRLWHSRLGDTNVTAQDCYDWLGNFKKGGKPTRSVGMLSRPQDFLAPGQACITWGPLFSAVKQVIRAGQIYDDHRSGIKQAIKSVDNVPLALAGVTVLHTLGLNVPPKVRAQLAGAKWMERLEKVLAKPQDPMVGLAVSQVLADWAFLYSNEELGKRAGEVLNAAVRHRQTGHSLTTQPSQVARDAADEHAMGIPQVGPRRGIDFVRLYHESVQQAAQGSTGGGSWHGSGSHHNRSGPLNGLNPVAAGATGGSSKGHNSSSSIPLGSISISAGGGDVSTTQPASLGGTFWATSAASNGHGSESFTSANSASIFQRRLCNTSAPLPVMRAGGTAAGSVSGTLNGSVSAGGRAPAAGSSSQAGLPPLAPTGPGSITYSLLDVDGDAAAGGQALAGGQSSSSTQSRPQGTAQQQPQLWQGVNGISDPNAALREHAASSQSVAPSMVPSLVDAMAYDAKALHAQAAHVRSLAARGAGATVCTDGSTTTSHNKSARPNLTAGLTQAVNEGYEWAERCSGWRMCVSALAQTMPDAGSVSTLLGALDVVNAALADWQRFASGGELFSALGIPAEAATIWRRQAGLLKSSSSSQHTSSAGGMIPSSASSARHQLLVDVSDSPSGARQAAGTYSTQVTGSGVATPHSIMDEPVSMPPMPMAALPTSAPSSQGGHNPLQPLSASMGQATGAGRGLPPAGAAVPSNNPFAHLQQPAEPPQVSSLWASPDRHPVSGSAPGSGTLSVGGSSTVSTSAGTGHTHTSCANGYHHASSSTAASTASTVAVPSALPAAAASATGMGSTALPRALHGSQPSTPAHGHTPAAGAAAGTLPSLSSPWQAELDALLPQMSSLMAAHSPVVGGTFAAPLTAGARPGRDAMWSPVRALFGKVQRHYEAQLVAVRQQYEGQLSSTKQRAVEVMKEMQAQLASQSQQISVQQKTIEALQAQVAQLQGQMQAVHPQMLGGPLFDSRGTSAGQPVLNGSHQAAPYKLPNGTTAGVAFPDAAWQLH